MTYEDEENQSKRKRAAAQKQIQLRDSIRNVLATSDGRAVLSACLGTCGLEIENTANGETAFRIEGARTVGIRIMRMLRDADKENFFKLYKEMTDA